MIFEQIHSNLSISPTWEVDVIHSPSHQQPYPTGYVPTSLRTRRRRPQLHQPSPFRTLFELSAQQSQPQLVQSADPRPLRKLEKYYPRAQTAQDYLAAGTARVRLSAR